MVNEAITIRKRREWSIRKVETIMYFLKGETGAGAKYIRLYPPDPSLIIFTHGTC